jgi:hypothetical protein
MTRKELGEVASNALLFQRMCSTMARQTRPTADGEVSAEEITKLVWMVGHATVLHDELQAHLGALDHIVAICDAVQRGRYLEDYLGCHCHWGEWGWERACTSIAECVEFAEDGPYAGIAYWLSECAPFSASLRDWILSQWDLQRSRRALLHGPEGLFAGAKVQMCRMVEQADGTQAQVPMDAEEAAQVMASRDAKEDTANESIGLRIDQYALNLERMQRICQDHGDLQEIVTIICDGMPPQLRRPVSPS